MPNPLEFLNALLPGSTTEMMNGLLRKNEMQRRQTLSPKIRRIVLILEGEDMMPDEEQVRDPFKSLPPRIPRSPGFQT